VPGAGGQPGLVLQVCHGDPSPRHARRAQLGIEVARIFAKEHGRYGAPRITADLRDAGWRVRENTVAELMREQGLHARPNRRRKSTTRPGPGSWRASDLVGRQFAAEQLNRKWYGDGTEIATAEGKLYPDSVLDVASRRLVGFALGEHHDAASAYAALVMTIAVRGGKEVIAGVVFHTDQGSEGVHRRRLPRRLRPAGRAAVDGPGRLGAEQRGHRVLALHPGVRTAPGRFIHHPHRRPSSGGRLDRGLQPHPAALRAGHALADRLRTSAARAPTGAGGVTGYRGSRMTASSPESRPGPSGRACGPALTPTAGAAPKQLRKPDQDPKTYKIENHKSEVSTVPGDCRNGARRPRVELPWCRHRSSVLADRTLHPPQDDSHQTRRPVARCNRTTLRLGATRCGRVKVQHVPIDVIGPWS
jgi:hypothetical protein